MYKKLILSILALVLCLGFMQGASAITLSGIPDVSFNEDSSNNTIDLDDYVSGVTGTVTYSYSGNTHIQVSIDANNIVTFTADKDWNGKETITFTATDDSDSDTDDVAVTVNPVNDAPVLNLPTSLTAKENEQFTYDVSKNVSDVDGDTLKYYDDTDLFDIGETTGIISFTPTELDVGSYQVAITVNDGTVNVSKTINFKVAESCDDGALVISDVSVDDVTGDDDQLEPGDSLDLDFDVVNKLTSQRIEDIKVKAWIEDADGNRVSDKAEADKFDVDEKDSENVDLTVKLDPDIKEGTYTLVIEARGDDEDGQTRCNTYTKSLKVEKSEHSLLINSVQVIPSTISCGRTIEISTHIYNTGTKNEDDIKLEYKIADLGIDEYSEFFSLNDRKDVTKTQSITIPSTAKAGNYWLEVIATFNGGDDEATYDLIPITITCEAVPEETTPQIISMPTTTASAQIGETIKFSTTLTNTGTATTTYTISLSDVSSWADANVEPSTLTLAPGMSMPVYIYITPKSASTHTIVFSVFADGQLAATKTLTVDVISGEAETIGATSGIQTTDWGHSISTTQTKAFIKDYVGTAGLIILVALLCVLGMTLYVLHNKRAKPKVIYESNKDKKRGRKRK